jgi:predicted transcriptional regulator of viral defense system
VIFYRQPQVFDIKNLTKPEKPYLCTMKVAAQIRGKIKSMPEGSPFGYSDLGVDKKDFLSAAKSLERLQKKGAIKRVSKGLFYIPRKTAFGELGPDNNGILERYLFVEGKRVAYETGFSLYNRLGLTTQMAFKIKVATKGKPIKINIGTLHVSSVKSYVDVTEHSQHLLGFLDALKDVKRIPDCSVLQAVRRMSYLINDLKPTEKNELIQYALLYPARVRALLGAILENLDANIRLDELKNSLNPLTKMKLSIKATDLPAAKNWNIE